MSRMDTASLLCKLVFDGDLPLLRRMIRAGIAIDAGDYDQRTALHIAACEGNLTAVRPFHTFSCSYSLQGKPLGKADREVYRESL